MRKPKRGMWAYGSTNVVDFRDWEYEVLENDQLRRALQELRTEVDSLVETAAAYIPFHNASRLGVALGRAKAALSDKHSSDNQFGK